MAVFSPSSLPVGVRLGSQFLLGTDPPLPRLSLPGLAWTSELCERREREDTRGVQGLRGGEAVAQLTCLR